MVLKRWLKRKRIEADLNALHGQSMLRLSATVAIAFVADVFSFIWLFSHFDKKYGEGNWPDFVDIDTGVYALTSLATLILLPVALKHVPREHSPFDSYPGTTGTFIASLLIFAGIGVFPTRISPFIVLISFCSRGSLRWVVVGVATITVSLGIRVWDPVWLATPFTSVGAFFMVWGVTIFPAIAIGLARGQRREKQSRLLAQAEHVTNDADRLAAQIRQEERDKIARDMHDTLSHRLSLISVYAGGLKFNTKLTPGEVRESASTIQSEAESAVQDLRNVLRTLRFDERVDPRSTIEDLVDKARAAGSRISVKYESEYAKESFDSLPTMAIHAINNAVQEGLTNVRKHAPGKRILIDVSVKHNNLVVTMRNCKHKTSESKRSGFGLQGLKERARLVGGTFNVEESNKEFAWALTLPIQNHNLDGKDNKQ